MSDQDTQLRFEELEAGRILGDLTAEETQEWEALVETHQFSADSSLELITATIETEAIQANLETIPDSLAAKLRQNIPRPASAPDTPHAGIPPSVAPFPARPRLLSSPSFAWAAAALFAFLYIFSFFVNKPDTTPVVISPDQPAQLSPAEAREKLLAQSRKLVQSDFSGTEKFSGMSGQVVWSDELQEGYMTLTNLPANNPTENQYQLWIVDPTRDEKPVDGGVFDIPQGQNTAVIPISNPLAVTNPQAFVITLEQPGGVVVSKQETVVALATAS